MHCELILMNKKHPKVLYVLVLFSMESMELSMELLKSKYDSIIHLPSFDF